MPESYELPFPAGIVDGVHGWIFDDPRARPAMRGSRTFGHGTGPVPRKGRTHSPANTPGWLTFSAGRILFKTSLPVDQAELAVDRVERFISTCERMLATPSRENRIYRVRGFGTQEDFCRYAALCGAATAESLYDPRTEEIAFWHEPEKRDRSWLERILAHETLHAYVHLTFNRLSPLWLMEGLAEYVANFRWVRSRAVPGAVGTYVQLVLSTPGTALLPMDQLLGADRSMMYDPNRFQRLYAQSWALTHFLMSARPDLVHRMLSRDEGFDEVGALEDAFEAHLSGLLAAPAGALLETTR